MGEGDDEGEGDHSPRCISAIPVKRPLSSGINVVVSKATVVNGVLEHHFRQLCTTLRRITIGTGAADSLQGTLMAPQELIGLAIGREQGLGDWGGGGWGFLVLEVYLHRWENRGELHVFFLLSGLLLFGEWVGVVLR